MTTESLPSPMAKGSDYSLTRPCFSRLGGLEVFMGFFRWVLKNELSRWIEVFIGGFIRGFIGSFRMGAER